MQSRVFKLAEDFRVGDMVYGRRIHRIEPYQVPAKVLTASVAAKHPEGLPAVAVYSGTWGMTLFLGDKYPEDADTYEIRQAYKETEVHNDT